MERLGTTAPLTGPGRRLRFSSFALHCVAVGATGCSAVEGFVWCSRLCCIAWRWARRLAARSWGRVTWLTTATRCPTLRFLGPGRVAELADAQDSGSCDRKIVGVQVPPRPPRALAWSDWIRSSGVRARPESLDPLLFAPLRRDPFGCAMTIPRAPQTSSQMSDWRWILSWCRCPPSAP